jgi:hypothetical protein
LRRRKEKLIAKRKLFFVILYSMTTTLKNIISKINKMPVSEQNAIASLLHEELAWKKSFENSQEQLGMLAAEAVAEYKKGKTQPLRLK